MTFIRRDPITDHPLVCAAIKRDVLAGFAARGIAITAMPTIDVAREIVFVQRSYFGGGHSTARVTKRELLAALIAVGEVPYPPTRVDVDQFATDRDLAAD